MTQRGMSSGREGSVGIIIAIRAIRHIWSEILKDEHLPHVLARTGSRFRLLDLRHQLLIRPMHGDE